MKNKRQSRMLNVIYKTMYSSFSRANHNFKISATMQEKVFSKMEFVKNEQVLVRSRVI